LKRCKPPKPVRAGARNGDALARLKGWRQALQRGQICDPRGKARGRFFARVFGPLSDLFLVLSWAGLWLGFALPWRGPVGLALFVLVAWRRCGRWSGFAGRAASRGLSRPRPRGSGIAPPPGDRVWTDTLVTKEPGRAGLVAGRKRGNARWPSAAAGFAPACPAPRLRDPRPLGAAARWFMVIAGGDPYFAAGRRTGRWRIAAAVSIGTACWRRPISGSMPGVTPTALYRQAADQSCRPANKEGRGGLPPGRPVAGFPPGSTLIVRSSGGTLDGRGRAAGRSPRAATRRAGPEGHQRKSTFNDRRPTAPSMSARPPASPVLEIQPPPPISRADHRNSPKDPEAAGPRLAAECPTRSRTITASPKPRRIFFGPPAPDAPQKPTQQRPPKKTRRPQGTATAAVRGAAVPAWCLPNAARTRNRRSARPSRNPERGSPPSPTASV